MTRGKIIVIEGTDCSGKETQSKMLIERLNKENMHTTYMSFPAYSSPTGRIVGLPYLGKPYLAQELVDSVKEKVKEKLSVYTHTKHDELITNLVLEEVAKELGHGWFSETAPNVDPKVSCLFYAADRKYNLPEVEYILNQGENIILDRYTYSNMAHQGGKIQDEQERLAMYKWISDLEFSMMGLPESDVRLFLHMPTDYSELLRNGRSEALDENEKNNQHLYDAERAYIEVAKLYGFDTIECIKDKDTEVNFSNIKTPGEINEEVYTLVKRKMQ